MSGASATSGDAAAHSRVARNVRQYGSPRRTAQSLTTPRLRTEEVDSPRRPRPTRCSG